jgi:hypothetical protein
MDDVCYVYDEHGTYIRGKEAVGQKVSSGSIKERIR